MAKKNDKERGGPPTEKPSGPRGVDPGGLPTLSDMLIGFQKSMARVAQATARTTREDPLFLYGRRNLYYIDEVDVETVVHIRPDEDPEAAGEKSFERIRLLTEDRGPREAGESSPGWTRLRFKLVGRYLDELLDRPSLFLSLAEYRKRYRDYRIVLKALKGDGTPDVHDDITVEVLPDGRREEGARGVFSGLATNELGVLELRLVVPKDAEAKAALKLGSRKLGDVPWGDSFVVRACVKDVDPETKKPVERVTAYAPLVIDRGEFEADDHD